MKKSNCRLAAAMVACIMCAGSLSVGAQGGALSLEYNVNGQKAAAPMPGALKTSVEISGTENDAKLITALYDSRTGALEKTVMSEKTAAGATAETNLSIDTLDGYTLRQFIWEDESMKPLDAAQEHAIVLEAQHGYKNISLTWKPLTSGLAAESYSIYKNGTLLEQGISADRCVYRIGQDSGAYRIAAVDEKGRIISVSNEVSVDAAGEDTFYFDTENMRHENGTTAIKNKTYGSADGQIVAGGNGSLSYNEEEGVYRAHEGIGDGCWGVEVIGGRTAMFSTGFKDGNADKKGVINFMLGSSFTPDYDKVKLTFDYYDEGTDNFAIKYVNGTATGNFATKYIKRTNTNTWKTAVVEMNGAFFNTGTATGLYDGTADFRFESLGKPIHISNIKIERGEMFVGAEFDFNSEYKTGINTTLKFNTKWQDDQLIFIGDGNPVEETADDANAKYITNGASDAAYAETEIGGRKALMTAYYKRNDTRPEREYTNGNIYFSLGNHFYGDNESVKVIVDYYDNSNENFALQYVNKDGKTVGPSVKRTNSNQWKTAEFSITDANWASTLLLNGHSDFRFLGGGKEPIYVSGVRVKCLGKDDYEIKSENADKLYPDGVSFAVTADGYTSNGIGFVDNKSSLLNSAGDGYSVYEAQEGSAAVSTASYGYGDSTGNNLKRNTFLYFNIADDYMYGMHDSYAEFEIEYFDCSDKNILLHYNRPGGSISEAYTAKVICKETGTNTWKTAKVTIDNASFKGAQNFGSDFRLSIEGKTADDQLKIRSVKVKNISHKKVTLPGTTPKVYIASDSIAANYAADSQVIGWGMRLPQLIDSEIEVVNYAVPGSSTKTFGSFDRINNELSKNDYVLMSFGHNDSMSDARGTTVSEYKANMKQRITEALERMAVPVVISSIPTYNNGVMDNDGIDAYRKAAQEVADEMNVAFIDLNSELKAFLSELTVDEALEYYVYENSDRRVHLSDKGATKVAEMIRDGLAGSDKIRVLKDYIN